MKAILEFTLPEEKNEFLLAQKGSNYFNVLHEFREWFIRYHKDNLNYMHVDKIWDGFLNCLNEVNLDEID